MRNITDTILENALRNPPLILSKLHNLLGKGEGEILNNRALYSESVLFSTVMLDIIEGGIIPTVVSRPLIEVLKSVPSQGAGKYHLNGPDSYYFYIPSGTLKMSHIDVTEICVTILPPDSQHRYCKNSKKDLNSLLISMYGLDKKETYYIGSRFKEGENIDDILKSAYEDLGHTKANREEELAAISLVLNLVLYYNSSDPDIMALKPDVYNTRNFRENYLLKGKDETKFFKYQLMGWDFHGREYSVDIGTRKGHFRWQPHGPQNSLRKLIYISDTIVNYRKPT